MILHLVFGWLLILAVLAGAWLLLDWLDAKEAREDEVFLRNLEELWRVPDTFPDEWLEVDGHGYARSPVDWAEWDWFEEAV